ncbi:chorismate mutase [Bacillus sp. SG-1]|uniref:chorismate mutase n=1 Tax=Bacillus sp. SG-1 TaxID=161544 RepID=UPI0002D4C76A|nr:chorismate mutase [Bacillus sp. SG-1]
MIRGVRGAITISSDSEKEIISSTELLLLEMINKNGIEPEQVASVFISATADIHTAFPARALRKIKNWKYVPVLSMQEMEVKDSLNKCIRIMIHWNTEKKQEDIRHVYLRKAHTLRPDLLS